MGTKSEFNPPQMIGRQVYNGVYDVTRAVGPHYNPSTVHPSVLVWPGWGEIVSVPADAALSPVLSPLSLKIEVLTDKSTNSVCFVKF